MRFITKSFTFHAAHRLRLPNRSDEENQAVFGVCAFPHGHTYQLQVTLAGAPDANGMILLFGKVVALPFVNELFASSLLISGEDVPDGAYDAQNMKQTVVPFRNGIMLAIAAGYAESLGASRVLIGSHSGDHAIYPDCRPQFNAAMSAAIAAGTGNQVALEVPFAGLDKRDIGDLGRRMGVDFRQTWTCYKGGRNHCGTCGACDERKYALRWEAGLDPTEYDK